MTEDMRELVHTEEMRKRRRAASDPTRMRITSCFYLRDRWTAKEIGEELGLNPNGLYYHLRILEEAKLIKVVDTQAVGRMVERVYGWEGLDQRVIWDANEPVEMAMNLAANIEASRAKAEEVLYKRARQIEAGEDKAFITWAAPALTTMPEEIPEFYRRLDELIKEFRDRGAERARDDQGERKPGSVWLNFTYMLFEQELSVKDTSA